MTAANADLEVWEHHIESELDLDARIPTTEREALIVARRGQGLFKERVMQIERACRITGVDNLVHLRASHCKPWRDSDNSERLDGQNGLLLTPSIDHLFDRGFISFGGDGALIISPVAHQPSQGLRKRAAFANCRLVGALRRVYATVRLFWRTVL
jgi:putative restriction endonuclease